MKMGIMFFAGRQTDQTYDLLFRCARFADRSEFSAVWLPERHFTDFGGPYPSPVILLAALARETRNIHLRAGSVVAPLHDAVRIAEDWSVVDNISNGRVGIALAPGWNPVDFTIRPEAFLDRHQRTFRAVSEIRRLWRLDEISRPDGLNQSTVITIRPRPIQPQVPIWLSVGSNPEGFTMAGKSGSHLLTFLLDKDLVSLKKNLDLYWQGLRDGGHSKEEATVTLMLHTLVHDDGSTARALAREPFTNYLKSIAPMFQQRLRGRGISADLSSRETDEAVDAVAKEIMDNKALIGSPEECAPLLNALQEIGVNEIACLLDFGLDSTIIEDGLPALNRLRSQTAPANRIRARQQERALRPEDQLRGFPKPNVIDGADHLLGRRLWSRGNVAIGRVSVGMTEDDVIGVLKGKALKCCETVLQHETPSTTWRLLGMKSIEIQESAAPSPGSGAWVRVTSTPAPSDAPLPRELTCEVLTDAGTRVIHLQRISYAPDHRPQSGEAWTLNWTPLDPPIEIRDNDLPGSWQLISDSRLVLDAVQESLSNAVECIHACLGRVEKHAEDRLDLCDEQDVERLNLCGRESNGIILVLAGVDSNLTIPDVAEKVTIASLMLIRHLTARNRTSNPRLWLCTVGAQAAGQQARVLRTELSPIWGIGRTLRLEDPDVFGGLIDLDPTEPAEQWTQEISSAIRERLHQVAFRNRLAFIPTIEKAQSAFAPSATLKKEGSYLVVGGLGGFAFEVCRWIAQACVGRLVIVGRTPVNEDDADRDTATMRARLDELKKLNTPVEYHQADISSEEDVVSLVHKLSRPREPRLLGVIHAASVWKHNNDILVRTFPLTTLEGTERVLRPKVKGAWLLAEHIRPLELDFFAFFSSAASLLGSPGQGNYAAACAFLDAIANQLESRGSAAYSFAWGPISQAGFADTQEGARLHSRWAKIGMKPTAPSQAIKFFSRMISQPPTGNAILTFNPSFLSERVTLMSGLNGTSRTEPGPATQNGSPARRPPAIDGTMSVPKTEQYLCDLASRMLGSGSGDIAPDTTLESQGFDSLLAIELKTHVESDLGFSIPLAWLLERPSPKSLAVKIASALGNTGHDDD